MLKALRPSKGKWRGPQRDVLLAFFARWDRASAALSISSAASAFSLWQPPARVFSSCCLSSPWRSWRESFPWQSKIGNRESKMARHSQTPLVAARRAASSAFKDPPREIYAACVHFSGFAAPWSVACKSRLRKIQSPTAQSGYWCRISLLEPRLRNISRDETRSFLAGIVLRRFGGGFSGRGERQPA